MNNEQPQRSVVEEAQATLRHPSVFGDAPSRLHREALERQAATRICSAAAQLHDFFRYGDPASTEQLELFLHESQTGLHAEVLLDEVEAAILTLQSPRSAAGAL